MVGDFVERSSQYGNSNMRGPANHSMTLVARDDDLSYTDIVNTNEDEEDEEE